MFKVSVIIPTYNRATLVVGAMESAIGQTHPVHEVIVVDDGSTDRTEEQVGTFAGSRARHRTSVVYLRQPQSGASVARNTGIAAAKGDWIAFLDSDDGWLPNKLELQFQAISACAGSCGACVTDASYINNSLLKQSAFRLAGVHFRSPSGLWPNAAASIASGHNGMYLQTLVVQSEIARSLGGFDTSLRLSEDTDFLFRVACHTGICYVDNVLVQIDRTSDREVGLIELARGELFRLQTCQQLFEKWLAEDGSSLPGVREGITRQLQALYTAWASWHLLNGDRKKALDALSQALRYKLTLRTASKWLLTKWAPEFTKTLILKRRRALPAEILF
ncbi:MAG: glycosyltransferase family A protein [Candidatus Sulfotelmatobacter sp.]|jgi:hypothetical protein